MSKCSKVKNPCKICLRSVTQKTGLQCQGACESWVHYSCLNYTPGRIKDIKAGIIKVTCPCPDCKTQLPREFRTDEPYSCTNMQCPANRPPHCGNDKCPSGGMEKMNQTSVHPMPQNTCALGKCGVECKQHVIPDSTTRPPFSAPCAQQLSMQKIPARISSDNCIDFSSRCQSGCSFRGDVAGDMRRPNGGFSTPNIDASNFPSLNTMEQLCNTIGLLSTQINNMVAKMRRVAKGTPKGKTKGCCHRSCNETGYR